MDSHEKLYILPSGNGLTLSDIRSVRAAETARSGDITICPAVVLMVADLPWHEDCVTFEAACDLRDKIIVAIASITNKS